MTSVYQGLCLSRSMGRVGENPGNEVVTIAFWSQVANLLFTVVKTILGLVNLISGDTLPRVFLGVWKLHCIVGQLLWCTACIVQVSFQSLNE